MDASNKIQPVMNQRGYYVAMHTEGGEIPQALIEQCWTSEREARIGLSRFFSVQTEGIKIEKKIDVKEEV